MSFKNIGDSKTLADYLSPLYETKDTSLIMSRQETLVNEPSNFFKMSYSLSTRDLLQETDPA
jgi:hypothetical protein